MLAEYFESPSRMQEIRDCPAGHLLEGFAQALYEVAMHSSQLAGICARPSISFIGLAERSVRVPCAAGST